MFCGHFNYKLLREQDTNSALSYLQPSRPPLAQREQEVTELAPEKKKLTLCKVFPSTTTYLSF